jgi:hypothetical protein
MMVPKLKAQDSTTSAGSDMQQQQMAVMAESKPHITNQNNVDEDEIYDEVE